MIESESEFVYHTSCPRCTERGEDTDGDNLAVYDDGHGYCFACSYYVDKADVELSDSVHTTIFEPPTSFVPLQGTPDNLPARKISAKTTKEYGYFQSGDVQVANYYFKNTLVGQKVRTRDKDFYWNPKGRYARELFGQHLCKHGGKMLVITEGEIDAMSVKEVMKTWPAVSIYGGAKAAVRNIKDNLEFVVSYDKVILCFDQDEEGQNAALAVAQMLPPGKAYIAKLPYKDANKCLQEGAIKELYNAIWEAKLYSPDEVLHVSQIETNNDIEDLEVWEFPWDSVTEFLLGHRPGEITLYTSGTGSGKTTILKEIAHGHLDAGRSVGLIMLEESPEETKDDMISYLVGKPIRSLRAAQVMNKLREKMGKPPIQVDFVDPLSDDDYFNAKKKLEATNLYIYDHLGNKGMQNLLSRIEYMATTLDVDIIVLDHITAAATGLINSGNNQHSDDERRLIDDMMKEFRSIAVRTGVHIAIVSQLKKTSKAYEEGDRITLQDLRGSGSLSSVPNVVVALERNRQSTNDLVANTTLFRVLKNRLTGRAGIAAALYYSRETGKLQEVPFTMDQDGEIQLQGF